MTLSKEVKGYQWALPDNIDVPPDELKCRLDFYQDTTVLYLLDRGIITTRVVSANDIAMALLSEVPMRSGLLPEGVLFWKQSSGGVEVGLYRAPRIWPVALQIEAFKDLERFRIPMPGLIFVCSPGRPPAVYAVKKRPKSPKEAIYKAPLFNLFQGGWSCAGSHRYPTNVGDIPESFFTSIFTPTADIDGRSRRHPNSLYALWKELDGERKYPLSDLVRYGSMENIMR